MKIAFLFAGQGSQYCGMGKDLYDEFSSYKDIFDNIDCDFDIKDISFNENELINNTQYAQPTIVAMSYAIAKLLNENGINPDYVAGLSLGEYTSLAYANVYTLKDIIKIVSKRGLIMEAALKNKNTGMRAVLNLDADTINAVISSYSNLCIANYNCPGQIVISGSNEQLDIVEPILKEKGARKIMPLNVSGAFHSMYLNDASLELKEELEKYPINDATLSIISNTYASEYPSDIVNTLTNHICSSVKFEQSIKYMISQGVDTFIEIGPGKALSSFVRKVDKDLAIYNVNNSETLRKVIEELNNGK